MRSIPEKITLTFLYLFVCSLGFEYWDKVNVYNGMTLPRLLAILYVTFSMLNIFSKKFNIKFENKVSLRPAIFLLFVWWFILLGEIVTHIKGNSALISMNLTFLQTIILFVFIRLDVGKAEKNKEMLLLSFCTGVFLIFILINLGIGIQSGRELEDVEALENVRRVWFMGLNPNTLGGLAAISFVLCLYFLIIKIKENKFWLFLSIPLMAYPILIMFSGSAGGFIALFLGVGFLFYQRWLQFYKAPYYLLLGTPLLIFLTYFILSGNETIATKISGLFDGEASGRFALWKAGLSIINEHMVFGLGGQHNTSKYFLQLNIPQDTAHNVFIDVFLFGGIFAFFAFLIFFFYMFKLVKKYPNKDRIALDLALLICVIFIMSKSGGGLTLKYCWVLLAIIGIGYTGGRGKYVSKTN
ncbi:O-antigen ligase family protein [Psychrobacter okhotskensis]|uniref:O-antigen ligase family protein n=1 Tax=Psychrobacter okhotskensis TaxID=212403 RepID=UPI0015652F02|nr:O-antigen ligase family protein [Psychrobacter okhotskensis]NRD69955.1 O-antigen ligase family protein [Psychrobacter okhotskensis]